MVKENITKILVRKKKPIDIKVVSKFLKEYKRGFKGPIDFLNYYGYKRIMKELFLEDVEVDEMEKSTLYQKYAEAVMTGKENDYFEIVYSLSSDLAAKINSGLYFIHLVDKIKINGEQILPWFYHCRKWHVTDVKNHSTEEILNDLLTLPYVEFLMKYKIY